MPAAAMFTVCPGEHSIAIFRVIASVFVVSELYASVLLGRRIKWKLDRKVDWVSVLALPVLIVAVLVIALSVYALAAV